MTTIDSIDLIEHLSALVLDIVLTEDVLPTAFTEISLFQNSMLN